MLGGVRGRLREEPPTRLSTRKMQQLLSSMGVDNISPGSISNITAGLDEQVAVYKSRSLSSHYPVMWIDAVYEKIRGAPSMNNNYRV